MFELAVGCTKEKSKYGLFAAIAGKFQSIGGEWLLFKMDLKVCNRAKVSNPPLVTKSASGPEPTLAEHRYAAAQLSHCGHSCTAQHFFG